MNIVRFPLFAEYFCELIKEHEPNTRQVDLAKKLGVSQGSIAKIKSGILLPSDELGARIAATWGVSDIMERLEQARSNDSAKAIRHSPKMEEEVKIAQDYIEAMMRSETKRELLGRYSEEFSVGNVTSSTSEEIKHALIDIYKVRHK